MEKYHRTVYELEVLSNEHPLGMSLEDILFEITYGNMSGQCTEKSSREVTAEEMADLLVAQGSDPDFLISSETE